MQLGLGSDFHRNSNAPAHSLSAQLTWKMGEQNNWPKRIL